VDAWESLAQSGTDKIAVTLTGNGSTGLLFSSFWQGIGTQARPIDVGKIKVRSAGQTQNMVASVGNPQYIAATYQTYYVYENTEPPATLQSIINRPNPFSHETIIEFGLDAPENVTLRVYDNMGHLVRVLHDGYLNTGTHEFRFEPENIPDGLYIYSLTSSVSTRSGRMLLTW
jgi:hypothetical protein